MLLGLAGLLWIGCGGSEEVARAPGPQPRVVPPGSGEQPDLATLPESGTRVTDGLFRLSLPDTLRYAVAPGQAWIETLPSSAEGALIVYRPLSAPALSWVVDGALFAQTLPEQRGQLRFDLQRFVGGYTDTLVVVLDLDASTTADTTAMRTDMGANSTQNDG